MSKKTLYAHFAGKDGAESLICVKPSRSVPVQPSGPMTKVGLRDLWPASPMPASTRSRRGHQADVRPRAMRAIDLARYRLLDHLSPCSLG